MNAKHAKNCEELRSRFEGKEAILVEQGALRVQVSNIEAQGFGISADVEEIPTPGLGVGRFHRPGAPNKPMRRRRFRAGYLTRFSAESWEMGYGGWTLYFAPRVVQAVIDFAARLPKDADTYEAYKQVSGLAFELTAHEPTQQVFPDVVEPRTGRFRRSDLPAVVVEVSSDWVSCPFCDKRFKLYDARRWDGEMHVTCGQRIIINVA